LVVERVGLLRADFAAPRAPEPLLLAVDARLDPELADLARAEVDFLAPELARDELLRPPLLRAERDDELEPELVLASPSIVHLPDITRCAASATASAMIEPSLVALDTTLVAACEAVSAASRPASRILRRAAGLALIAAAAAARPAASISLLIAAFASLSRLSFLDREELEEPEELVLEDLAIAFVSLRRGQDT
jgi:hypothetical protein